MCRREFPVAASPDDSPACRRSTCAGAAAGRGGAAGGVRGGGARGTGGAGGAEAAGAGRDAAGGAAATGAPAPSGLIANTLLQTLQRARKPPAGTLAGSTRYTVSHEGHVTFTPRLRFLRRPGRDRAAGRPRTPILPASSRNSSSRSPTHSPAPSARTGGAGSSRRRSTASPPDRRG